MTRRPRVLVAALGLVTTVGLAACSGGGDRAPAPVSSTPAPASATASSAASPFVVAAAAVGERSRSQVVALHALGTSTTVDAGVPRTELPAQGSAIRAALLQQVQDATRLPPPAGSAAARLATALRSYAGLADRLAAWNPSGAGLPQQWFGALRTTDTGWRAALRSLSDASGHDLLAGLPRLSEPAS